MAIGVLGTRHHGAPATDTMNGIRIADIIKDNPDPIMIMTGKIISTQIFGMATTMVDAMTSDPERDANLRTTKCEDASSIRATNWNQKEPGLKGVWPRNTTKMALFNSQ
jgi:hypothetical protein